MGVDADIDAAIAAGIVPDFISGDFLKQNRIIPATVGIALMVALACAVVTCRLLSRKFIIKRFGLGLDDGMILLSLLTFIPFAALCIVLVHIGAGRHIAFLGYLTDDAGYERFQIIDSVAHLIYITALMLCRVSGLAFYYRICSLHREFFMGIKIVFGILITAYLVQAGLIIFHCAPVTLLWDPTFPGDTRMDHCLMWNDVYVSSSIISLISDFFLFGIPVAMLWVLEMPQKRKVQLACILLPGVGVVGISIARVIAIYMKKFEDDTTDTYAFLTIIMIEVAEVAATLIALSIPGVKPLFDRYILRKKELPPPSRSSYIPKKGYGGESNVTALSKVESLDYEGTGMDESRSRLGDAKQGDIYVTVDFTVESEKA